VDRRLDVVQQRQRAGLAERQRLSPVVLPVEVGLPVDQSRAEHGQRLVEIDRRVLGALEAFLPRFP